MHLFNKYFISFSIIVFSFHMNAQSDIDGVLKKFNTESVPYITVNELASSLDNFIILDARERNEYNVSHISNAHFIGYKSFTMESLKDIPKDQKVVVYCSLGVRSEDIAEQLVKAGYTEVYNLYGGIFKWKNQNLTIRNTKGQKTDSIHAFSKQWSKYLTKGIKTYE